VITVTKPPQENKSHIIVETEPVLASLANILKNMANVASVSNELRSFVLEELEVYVRINVGENNFY